MAKIYKKYEKSKYFNGYFQKNAKFYTNFFGTVKLVGQKFAFVKKNVYLCIINIKLENNEK